MKRARRQINRRSKQRGVALIMVLSTLTVLAVMLTEFQQETSVELGSALAERDALQAEYAARSGIALTRLVIAAEPTVRKALLPLLMIAGMGNTQQIPIWEHADALLGLFNDEASAKAFGTLIGGIFDQTKGLGLPGARFEVTVVDEDSKLNFNFAARGTAPSRIVVATEFLSLVGSPQYDKLFSERDEQGNFNDRRTICAALIDWTDPDTEADPCTPQAMTATQTGAEDSYYEMLKVPYSRKNAAFDSLQEMHLVRGFGDEFWSTFVDPDPDDPERRNVTVWGSDKMNINTASGVNIMALVCGYLEGDSPACSDPVIRAKVISLVEMLRSVIQGVPMFHSASQFIKYLRHDAAKEGSTDPFDLGTLLQSLGIPSIKVKESQLKDRIKVKSDVFSIYAKGLVKSGKRETRTRIHAVVDFRGAPPPGQARSEADQAELQGAVPSPTVSLADAGIELPPGIDPSQVTSSSILSALQASAGGRIVYFRIN